MRNVITIFIIIFVNLLSLAGNNDYDISIQNSNFDINNTEVFTKCISITNKSCTPLWIWFKNKSQNKESKDLIKEYFFKSNEDISIFSMAMETEKIIKGISIDTFIKILTLNQSFEIKYLSVNKSINVDVMDILNIFQESEVLGYYPILKEIKSQKSLVSYSGNEIIIPFDLWQQWYLNK